jgi:hypothetical protein
VLFIAGDHVPVIPLFDVVGKALIVAPEQNGPTDVKVGSNGGVTVNTPLINEEPSHIPPPPALNPPYCQPQPLI